MDTGPVLAGKNHAFAGITGSGELSVLGVRSWEDMSPGYCRHLLGENLTEKSAQQMQG